jgi:hypothetical protein
MKTQRQAAEAAKSRARDRIYPATTALHRTPVSPIWARTKEQNRERRIRQAQRPGGPAFHFVGGSQQLARTLERPALRRRRIVVRKFPQGCIHGSFVVRAIDVNRWTIELMSRLLALSVTRDRIWPAGWPDPGAADHDVVAILSLKRSRCDKVGSHCPCFSSPILLGISRLMGSRVAGQTNPSHSEIHVQRGAPQKRDAPGTLLYID